MPANLVGGKVPGFAYPHLRLESPVPENYGRVLLLYPVVHRASGKFSLDSTLDFPRSCLTVSVGNIAISTRRRLVGALNLPYSKVSLDMGGARGFPHSVVGRLFVSLEHPLRISFR